MTTFEFIPMANAPEANMDELQARNRELEVQLAEATNRADSLQDECRAQLKELRNWRNATDCEQPADAKRLRAALEAVEWVGAHLYCPWCLYQEEDGHKPDCTRQDAMRLAE